MVYILLALLVLALSPACGDDGEAGRDGGAGRPSALALEDLPDQEAAHALPIAELAALYDRSAAEADHNDASAEGVRWSVSAAELARAIALRSRPDEADRWLGRAREHFTAAARRKALPGACEAALALARFEARDARDLEAAHLAAFRTVRRFRGESHGACLAEARRITAVLEAHRPGSDRLAAIAADPDADDPSATFAERAQPSIEVSEWAEGRSDVGRATLERIDVHAADGSDVARVVLVFDGVAVFERGELAASGELPRRAFLDLAGTAIGAALARTVSVGVAGLSRVRVAPFEPGVTRVVFDLEPRTGYRLFFLSDPYRIVVDFEAGTAAEVASTGERRAVRTLVLDPGHGGNEYGARHGGLTEKALTLDITQRVAAILERRLPNTQIRLTRSRDTHISLEERVAFANSVSADAFVSVHLNAADDPVEHGGVTTFVLDTTNDRQALRLAARENGTSTAEVSGLQRILAGLHREGQIAESRALAELVQIGTVASGRRVLPQLPDRGVKSAMFYVLVGARMPAILVEASFLTQADEQRALGTQRYRQALAEGIAEGIVRWAQGS